MKKRDFLLSAMLSTLLLTANLSAQQIECKNGKCFINLSKLAPTKNPPATVQNFKMKKIASSTPEQSIEPKTIEVTVAATTIQEQASNENQLEVIAFDHSTYVMQENEQLELINDELETIVFAPSKYIMTKAEIEQYYEQLNVNEEEINVHIAIADEENEKIEDKIIEKTILPTSEYYCENQKKAVYNQELKTYQCTI
ncbi:hypothetical protein KKC13_07860 [bacterium]|nr:hypothetical protein [bacterium]MBU1959068.1 hypothetical protein [bacterium]